MTRRVTLTAVAVALAGLCFGTGPATAPARAAAPTRIGTFDSRAVAIAYYRSEQGMRESRAMRDEYEKAKAANDTNRVKELEQEGPWRQIRMHQQAFSTATVATILEKAADRLPGIAKEAGVSAIVSKWEVPYKDPSIETVDVTLAIVRLFSQDDQILKMLDQVKAQPPIPFEKLPLDPNM